METEFEIKFLGIDVPKIREKLVRAGFRCTCEEYTMIRKTFHKNPRTQNEWFRIRQEKDRTTMTYKNISNDTIDGVQEIEITVNDFGKATELLCKTGLENTSTQENKREIWSRGSVEICLDTWPGLRTYIEIESVSENEVQKVASELGFEWSNGVFGGSEAVYEIELGIPKSVLTKMPEISFQNPPTYEAV